ncbi:MAG: hypothetical protein KDB31_07295 [Microthrixaceae bacterium]|nr:hypothetical protein [Microthrixaceae bacterium]
MSHHSWDYDGPTPMWVYEQEAERLDLYEDVWEERARPQSGPQGELDVAALPGQHMWAVVPIITAMDVTVYPHYPRSKPTGAKVGHNGDKVLRDGAVRASKRASAYCVANDLNHMLTLTYRGTAPSIEQVLRDSGNLRRSLARHLFDDSAFPWLRVLEWGTEHHRPHAHWMLGGQAAHLGADLWKHGDAHVEAIPDLAALRRVVEYLAKEFDKADRPKTRRYDPAPGFAPEVGPVEYFDTREEAITYAEILMGGIPPDEWLEPREWRGPLPVQMRWNQREY